MTTATRPALAVTLDPAELAAALGAVSRAISTRTTLPILQHVLVEATDEGLALTATNLEIGIRKVVPAEVTAQGATTVPARLLTDFVGCLPNAPLALALDDTTLTLKCGQFDTRIRCVPSDEFPPGPTADGASRLTIPLDGLLRAIEQTSIAASTEEARPVLTGVLLEIEGTTLSLVATDGHRLAEKRVTLDGGDTGIDGAKLIIPARALAELARVFRGESGNVDLLLAKARNQAFFRAGTSEVTSRLIDGQYPNYTQVIPSGTATTIVRASVAELRAAVKAVAPFARDAAHMIRLLVDHGRLAVTASAEAGDGRGEMDVVTEGEPVEIAFNGAYVLDALASVTGDTVELHLFGPLSPTLMRAPGDRDWLHVLMPIRVPGQ